MSRIYITVHRDTNSVYVGEVLAVPGCHSQGDSFQELLKNLAEAMELVQSEATVESSTQKSRSMYFELGYAEPEEILRKSILVQEILASLQRTQCGEAAAARIAGAELHLFSRVLRGVFRDTPEDTLVDWIRSISTGSLLEVVEMEQEADGRWLAVSRALASLAYGYSAWGAAATTLRSGAVTVKDDTFNELIKQNGTASLKGYVFHGHRLP